MSSAPIASFFVEGKPHPQGSKTPVFRGGKIILIEGKGNGTQLHKKWREAVSCTTEEYMKQNGIEEHSGIVRVELRFKIEKPKSKHKRVRAVSVRPDIDKLARAVLDGITSLKESHGIIPDDSHVVQLYAEKFYAYDGEATGVQIDIFDIEELRLDPEE
jgi:Holliday junction resolvase RusA-like endonuclease